MNTLKSFFLFGIVCYLYETLKKKNDLHNYKKFEFIFILLVLIFDLQKKKTEYKK